MSNFLIRLLILSSILIASLAWTACQSKSETKRYAMTGAVVAIHPDASTVTVHNDDLPGFMPPMDMDYAVKDKHAMDTLKPGDKIKATIVVEGHSPARLDDLSVATH